MEPPEPEVILRAQKVASETAARHEVAAGAVSCARTSFRALRAAHAAAVAKTGGVPSKSDGATLDDAGTRFLCDMALVATEVRAVYGGPGVVKDLVDTVRHEADGVRLELENFKYRREMLRAKVAELKAGKAEKLDMVVAAGLVEDDEKSVEGMEGEHKAMVRRLDKELRERKRLQRELDEMRKMSRERRERNEELKKHRDALPAHIQHLRETLKPIRDYMESGEGGGGDVGTLPADEISIMRALPMPLYVLAREAFGLRDHSGGHITFRVLDQDPADLAAEPVPAVSQKPWLPDEAVLAFASQRQVESNADAMDEVLRSDVGGGDGGDTKEKESAAIASDAAGDRMLDDKDSGGGGGGDDKADLANLHRVHPKVVRIDVHDIHPSSAAAGGDPFAASSGKKKSSGANSASDSAAGAEKASSHVLASLFFMYHPALNIVTLRVTSGPPVCAPKKAPTRKAPTQRQQQVDTADFEMLFPFDYGRQSPNPGNAHLMKGRFKFDSSLVPHGGRPFVWANLLCGLHFPGSVSKSVLKGGLRHVQLVQHLDWPDRAFAHPAHLRFKDAVNAVRRRVSARRSLGDQIATLSRRAVPLSWRCLGNDGAKEPETRLTYFALNEGGGGWEGYGISTLPSGGQSLQACSFKVSHSSGVELAGMIGIQRDYPLSRGLFRLTNTENASVKISGSDLGHIADNANVSGVHDLAVPATGIRSDGEGREASTQEKVPRLSVDGVHRNMTLGLQMMNLLLSVDAVATVLSNQAYMEAEEDEIPGSGAAQSGAGSGENGTPSSRSKASRKKGQSQPAPRTRWTRSREGRSRSKTS